MWFLQQTCTHPLDENVVENDSCDHCMLTQSVGQHAFNGIAQQTCTAASFLMFLHCLITMICKDLMQSRGASTDILRSSWLVSTNKKLEAHDVDVPSIKRIDHQLPNINDNYVFLMGDNEDQRGPEKV
ncbi:hypothetical protein D9C73_006945 [Collichthys lucidus]|uniref:Uncharacterized protein n=1 Tax=Collichthys lucidus TaxID=240159 RepID=A0A4U5UFI5_COLLU|nr:hypothetical protein D9C73_006945 [Collichthys lucidus]